MNWLIYALVALIFVFSSAIFVGAPYLPTVRPQTTDALDLLNLKPGQKLLELGSGDGRILLEAARRGISVTGYEINPILVIISKFRCRKYKQLVKVIWANYWKKPLPPADGLYVFLLNRYMPKLDTKINQDFSQPLKVVSFVFEFPNRPIIKEINGLKLYEFSPPSINSLN